MQKVSYRVEVNLEGGSYWAEVLDLPGCFAAGDTLDELQEALTEAIALYLSTDDVQVRVGGVALNQLRLIEDDRVPVELDLALA